ncbi:Ribosomal large subunit pseudouridine synthase F [Candidatus Izimaplasma bacterium HR1]|jgi:23S rRNA pseudouridine2604 synthase|nr:Ribosomal large subunit pseudouridine synthase F [Candidatus Izimaplasma bacterium HR1]
MEIRLNKYLSEVGYCSRREADRLIKDSRVTVNGDLPELGQKVTEEDEIKVDGKNIKKNSKLVYLALNKPKGITCTTDQTDPTNVVDFIKFPLRIFHIGRLDKDSEGLIFLTNDGDIVNKILRSGNKHEKEYVVEVDTTITWQFIQKMSRGVPVLGKMTKPCHVEKIDDYHFRITLTEGLNRQIRRMCTALNFHVTRLMRVRVMNITIDGIRPGKWRYLSNDEVKEIKSLTEHSSKTEEASN